MAGVTRLDLDFLRSVNSFRQFPPPKASYAAFTSTGSVILCISDPSSSKKSSEAPQDWKRRLCYVSSPFSLFGFPIHLIFDLCPCSSFFSDTCKGKHSSVNWLQTITRTSLRSSVLTVTFVVITSFWTLYTLSHVYTVVFHLGVLGQLNSHVSTSILRSLYFVPFVLPTLLTWVQGHRVKQLVEMFDEAKPHLLRLAYINNDEVNPQHLRPANALAYVNCKLIVFYALIYGALALQVLADYSIRQTLVLDHESVIHYCVIALYLLTLPIYSLLCWGLLYEIKLVSVYLRSLRIYGIRPSSAIFEQIKLCYKLISKHILVVNRTCKLFMCWAMPTLLALAIVNVFSSVLYLADPLYGWVTEILGYQSEAGSGLQGLVLNDWNGTAILESPTESVAHVAGDLALTPQCVRGAAGYFTVGALKIILVWYTYWQAVKVNDHYRLLHVLLNDFVTNSNVAAASTELYQAFQLLKLYVHSTMEYQSPSLLRIPILACLPYFGKRLHMA